MNVPDYIPANLALDVRSPITNGDMRRSPAALLGVISALFVEKAERYRRRDVDGDGTLNTTCNYFARDVCDALGVALPRPMRANGIIDWLQSEEGRRHEWKQVDKDDAMKSASEGRPVLACWYNRNGGSGHVAIVRPSLSGDVEIAQAGLTSFERGRLVEGFGTKPVTFFSHP